VVDDLANIMVGIEKDDIWECLRRDDGVQGNAVKVAYLLLQDDLEKIVSKSTCHRVSYSTKSSLVAEFAEAERDAQLAAMDVRSYLSFLNLT
jgi:carbon catabolite-derepressing protein kinase